MKMLTDSQKLEDRFEGLIRLIWNDRLDPSLKARMETLRGWRNRIEHFKTYDSYHILTPANAREAIEVAKAVIGETYILDRSGLPEWLE